MKDLDVAITNFTKVIELDPNYTSAYTKRGFSKYKFCDIKGACNDFRKAISLGSTENIKWVREQCK